MARPTGWLSRAARFVVVVLTGAAGLDLRLIGQRAQMENPFGQRKTAALKAGRLAEEDEEKIEERMAL